MRPADLATLVLCAGVALLPAASNLHAADKKKKPVSKTQQALLEAAQEGRVEAVEKALKAGAKVDGPDEDGNTPLMYAIVKNTFYGADVVKALLKAKASPNAKNGDGMTPLMFAAANGKNEHFAALLAAGAQVNAKDKDGWTPLMFGASKGSSFVVNDLLKAGADPKVEGTDGWTPLLLALNQGRSTSVEALLKAGATFGTTVPKGATLLLLAVNGDDMKSVELVLKEKPDVNGKDPDGWTPLILAAHIGNPDTLMALLRAGADPKLKDNEGLTALDRAKKNKKDECAALLGGPWEKRKPSGGATLSVPCDPLGGAVDVNVKAEGSEVVLSVFYPKPVGAYLGGFDSGVKKVSADIHVYLDVDNNPKTGLKPSSGVSGDFGTGGAEYEINLMEIGTSVRDEGSGKNVNRQVLDPSIRKGEESLSSDEMNGFFPRAERDLNAVRLRVPLSVFGLKPGAKIRVTARPGFCAPTSKVVTIG